MDLLQYIVSMLRGIVQWDSFYTPPHYLGGVGNASPALLQYFVSLLGSSGQRDSFNTLLH